MWFLDRLAEEKISQAIARGEFDELPGRGKPIPDEPGIDLVPEEMRTAYRLLKNAGYVPEELRVMREIDDLVRCVDREDEPQRRQEQARARLLLSRLCDMRSDNLLLQDHYFRQITDKLQRGAEEAA